MSPYAWHRLAALARKVAKQCIGCALTGTGLAWQELVWERRLKKGRQHMARAAANPVIMTVSASPQRSIHAEENRIPNH